MTSKIIRILALFICGVTVLQAQTQKKYQAEIGLSAGGAYYMGDANTQLFANTQPDFGISLRYLLSNRLAIRTEFNSTKIKGLYENTEFSNNVSTLDLAAEFNFFDLEKNEYKRFSKPFSPYIFGGLGLMKYNFSSVTITPAINVGIGFKVLLKKRWNLNMQWTHRLLLADNLENNPDLDNPYMLNGSNLFNKDLLSTFTIGFTYDIWEKECDCKNDNHKYPKNNYKKRNRK